MPLYEYECRSCQKRLEAIQRFSDPPYVICPHCGGELKKLISSPAIHFKGSGFYLTDYGKAGSKGASSSDSGSESSKDSGGESSKDSGSESSKDSGNASSKNSEGASSKDSGSASSKDSGNASTKDSGGSTAKGGVKSD